MECSNINLRLGGGGVSAEWVDPPPTKSATWGDLSLTMFGGAFMVRLGRAAFFICGGLLDNSPSIIFF